jgi:hypothetical protein
MFLKDEKLTDWYKNYALYEKQVTSHLKKIKD